MKKTLILKLFLQSFSIFSQTTYYVNHAAQGGQQNGATWENAFLDLQQALSTATDGDAIWVAQGTYFPTNTTDRSIYFTLKNGVKMYGGFLGTESSLGQRDFEANETILSGNIGLPKGSDNSYHVVFGEGLDSTTVLDGFLVTRGNANGVDDDQSQGGGLLLYPSAEVYNTCPVIRNCRFEYNYASLGGGMAILRWESSQNYINPIIQNCKFLFNRSNLYGGALTKVGPALAEHPFLLDHCVFAKNSSSGEGGGIFMSKTEYVTELQHCIFENDSSKNALGGGLYFASGYEAFVGATLRLDSCIFKENIAPEGGGLYYYDGGIPSFSIPPFKAEFSGCLFEKNISFNGEGAAYALVGENKSQLYVSVIDCVFLENLSHTYSITFLQGMKESKCNLSIKNCKYLNNKRLESPSLGVFPILFGVGSTLGRMDATIENCFFQGNGGGISSVCSSGGGKVKTQITNCTFYENDELIINKSYYPDFNGIDKYIETYVTNCIIWEPDTDLWSMFSDNDFTLQNLGGYHINHSLVSLDSLTTQSYPIFGENIISNKAPLFIDETNDDFHLHPCSPAVNAGSNIVVDTLGISTDLQGNPRILFETVDLGVYETQDSCYTIRSNEPLVATVTTVISPNPVFPGSAINIQIVGLKYSNIQYTIRDTYGRLMESGTRTLAFGQNSVTMAAPNIPGLYFLEVRQGERIACLKLVVQK